MMAAVGMKSARKNLKKRPQDRAMLMNNKERIRSNGVRVARHSALLDATGHVTRVQGAPSVGVGRVLCSFCSHQAVRSACA